MGILFMSLVGLKGPSFMRMIIGFLEKHKSFVVRRFVKKYEERFGMSEFHETDNLFKNFPYALEVVDVTFQQTNRLSGNMQPEKAYFSVKHKLYGFKVEASVRQNEIASSFSSHYTGSVSDFTIVQELAELHKKRLEKRDDDERFEYVFMLSEEFPQQWTVLMDKGYQGATEIIRAIKPRKKDCEVSWDVAMSRSTKSYHHTVS